MLSVPFLFILKFIFVKHIHFILPEDQLPAMWSSRICRSLVLFVVFMLQCGISTSQQSSSHLSGPIRSAHKADGGSFISITAAVYHVLPGTRNIWKYKSHSSIAVMVCRQGSPVSSFKSGTVAGQICSSGAFISVNPAE